MCGIFGTTKEGVARDESLGLIAHRGPDDSGTFSDNHIFLGHRRLSILDVSERGHQPMFNDAGNLSIIYNGETYNFQDIREELMAGGVSFKSTGDTEVILKGFETYGDKIFSKMRGMWALAVYNSTTNELTLARDHFGIKPLFYSINGKDVSFGSEAKTLLPQLTTKTPNTASYFLFYNLGYFPGAETSFKEVKKLLPGQILKFNLGSGEVKTSFANLVDDVADEKRKNHNNLISDETEAAALINESLLESVKKHYISDVPVGLLLSGGNDSSYLAALSKEAGKHPICFSVSIQESGDQGFARKVAEHLDLPFQEEIITPDVFLDQYKKLDEIIDQPTGDVSFIPTSLIYARIKGKSKVVLSGEGGDELFGGYLRHNDFAHFNTLDFANTLPRYSFHSRFGLRVINPVLNRVRKIFSFVQIAQNLGSAYLRAARVIDLPIQQKKVLEFMEQTYRNHPYKDSIQPNLFFDLFMYLPYNLMYKGDSSSMAYSIESRVPFLDKGFFNTLSKISPELKLSSSFKNKTIMKKAMEKYLPHELIYRKKSGFGIDMRKYAHGVLLQDLKDAMLFHRKNANAFAIYDTGIFDLLETNKADIILNKYPRFAYSLITNHKVMKSHV